MKKVDVLSIKKKKSSITDLDLLQSFFIRELGDVISRRNLKNGELKIFFKKPQKLSYIDKVLEKEVTTEEMRWYHQKKIGNGTSILEVLIR